MSVPISQLGMPSAPPVIISDYLLCHRERLVSAMAKELEKSEAYRGNFIKAALWAGRMFDAAHAAVGEG
jgi:hypothetical protein